MKPFRRNQAGVRVSKNLKFREFENCFSQFAGNGTDIEDMEHFKRISALAFLLVAGITVGAEAHTFLVDTWENADREDLEEEERFNHIALESGMMDVLFDKGHIFFNIYTSFSEMDETPPTGSALKLAGEEGADFLIELVPDENGAAWRLFSTSKMTESDHGYAAIDDIDEEMEEVQRWMSLGGILTGQILAAAH